MGSGASKACGSLGCAEQAQGAVVTLKAEAVDHPAHYGGAENPYEAIKVIEAWGLGFCLGNTVKYISRAGKKGDLLEDLKKAQWYLAREIEALERARKAGAT